QGHAVGNSVVPLREQCRTFVGGTQVVLGREVVGIAAEVERAVAGQLRIPGQLSFLAIGQPVASRTETDAAVRRIDRSPGEGVVRRQTVGRYGGDRAVAGPDRLLVGVGQVHGQSAARAFAPPSDVGGAALAVAMLVGCVIRAGLDAFVAVPRDDVDDASDG